MTVDENQTVTLDASGSTGIDPSYSWTQLGGPDVPLSGADTATPTFTTPDVSAETTLTFEVSVSAGTASDTDTVAVAPDSSGSPSDDTEHTLTVAAIGDDSSYEFSVTGEVAAAGSTLEANDSIDGSTASGEVAGSWDDVYTITGELIDLTVEGDATVYVDGEAVTAASVAPHLAAP